jgi:biopolymer transport protein ExbD
MLGRSQMNVAPILGVLMVIFVGFSWLLPMVEIQIPRQFHELCDVPETEAEPPRVSLHADGSIDLRTTGTMQHVEAPRVARTLSELGRPRYADAAWPNVVQLQADDGVLWGDFVATVSSVRHITRGEVLVASDEP